MKNELYEITLLPVYDYQDLDECQECTGCYNNGDWIIDTFFNGNWKDGVLQLLGLNVSPREFAEFVNEKVAEGFEDIGDFLDRDAFVIITELWYNLRDKGEN